MADERNFWLIIAYDGTGFSGWQRQPAARTVCGALEELLSDLCRTPVELTAASRTDAGVHVLGQSANFICSTGMPAEGLLRAANDALAQSRLERVGEIEIVSAVEMPLAFHARYDAKGKRYRYRIRNAEKPDIFLRNQCYQIADPLDCEAMQQAASHLPGEKDFRCFLSAGGNPQKSTVRRIDSCTVARQGDEVYIDIEGNGFLYHMARNIAGTLAEIGLGRRDPDDMISIIESKDRQSAGHTAPPQGLYLEEVFY